MLLVIPQGKQKFYGIVLFIPKEKVDLNVPLISDNLEKIPCQEICNQDAHSVPSGNQ